MAPTEVDDRSPGPRTRARWRWLVGTLLAALLAGCGGGSDAPDGGNPPPPPPPPAQAFTLFPSRLAMSVDEEGLVVALAAPGAVTWSSSDPLVASVDGAGRVKAVARGRTTVRATSGATAVEMTVAVYRTDGASPEASSEALIAQALAAGTIDAEAALTYRVYALFADPRLPAPYQGAPGELPDHLLLREVSGRLPTLSPATQDVLRPFLIPPVYAQSWHARQAHAAGGRSPADRKQRADLTISCAASQIANPPRTTAHFNLHTLFGDDPLQGDDNRPTAETVSDFIVSVLEEVYQSETRLFQRFPLPDTREPCNGGDGALDVYMFPLAGRMKSMAVAYPGRCEKVPAFIVLNSSELFLSFGIARSVPLAQKKKAWKSYIAHEFAHVLQFGMDRQAGCEDYKWLDEATATWVMDYVEPLANFEDGGERKSTPLARRAGRFYANYLYNDHRVSIENASPDSNPELNGYGDYLFFQYLARSYAPATIKDILDATESRASVEAIASVLEAKGGMKVVWPAFAATLWNDAAGRLLDDWSRLDAYDFGLAAIYSPTDAMRPTVASLKLKTLDVDQKGLGRASFKLLENANDDPGPDYRIEPRSMVYEHLRFSDPTVHSVYFSNPIAVIPDNAFMKLQVWKKIAGQWRAAEDWTGEPFKQFCLDKKDERLEELLLVVSNSEANRGVERPFLIPAQFPMQISTSNVGCWAWLGSASTHATGGPPTNLDAVGRATSLLFRAGAVLPGRIDFGTVGGTVSARQTSTVGGCEFTVVGASTDLYRGIGSEELPPTDDGTISVNLDLDLGFGAISGTPPDRKLVTLGGFSTLPSTSTAVCPASTTTSTGDLGFNWMRVNNAARFAVSADGQVIEGRWTGKSSDGSSLLTVWKFTALRQ